MLEGLNFKEFLGLLSAFSARATQDDKLKCEYFIERNQSRVTLLCVALCLVISPIFNNYEY